MGEKGRNEFGDPYFFSAVFTMHEHIIKFAHGKFQQILISRKITDESP
jgi:hypothetical protein